MYVGGSFMLHTYLMHNGVLIFSFSLHMNGHAVVSDNTEYTVSTYAIIVVYICVVICMCARHSSSNND